MNYKQNCIERLPRKKTNIRYIMWWNKFFPEWVRYRNFYYSLVEFYENSWLDGEEKYAIVISGKQTHKKFLNIIQNSFPTFINRLNLGYWKFLYQNLFYSL